MFFDEHLIILTRFLDGMMLFSWINMRLFLKFAMQCLKLHTRQQKKLHCLCPDSKPNQQLNNTIYCWQCIVVWKKIKCIYVSKCVFDSPILLNVDVTFSEASFQVLLQLMTYYCWKFSNKLCLHWYTISYCRQNTSCLHN